MEDQSNDKFGVNKITDGVSIALDQFTCTATERAFLDEIREKGEQYSFYVGEYRDTYIEIGESKLEQKDFKVDLRDFADEREDKEPQ